VRSTAAIRGARTTPRAALPRSPGTILFSSRACASAEIEANYPADYVRFKSRDQAHVIPGGESASQFRARVFACFDEISSRHNGELVVVITHGLVLDVLYRAALGIAPELPRIHELVNAGINRLRYDGGTWHIEVWGDASHLDAGALTSA